ncbi:MAG: ABC transporter ATP-binding protein [Erysipelotrichaceae bacterium]|nr:ABC transporter ATP-binding protein [Erysipelotrichaceae bacterium]
MEKKNIILSASDVQVEFTVHGRQLKAIRNISIDLYDGETLAIVGESGSGKSVFTKTFTGMLDSNGAVTNGRAIFEGKDLYQNKTDADWEKIRGKKIATIFQDPMTSLNPIMTIGKQITEVIMKHQGKNFDDAKAEAIKLMDEVGIYNAAERFDEYPFMYSGGMRQRIVIAIALACHPEILICDEPTTALDVTVQAQIIRLIKKLQKDYGYSIIFITHDLGVVANVADRVAIMYAGQIIEYGKVSEIFYDPKHPYTWGLLSSLPQLGIKGEPLYAIHGTPPSLYDEIKGDAFSPRSDYAMKIDFEEEPPMFAVSDTHFAKTWLLDPRAPKVEPPVQVRELHKRMLKVIAEQEEKIDEQQ